MTGFGIADIDNDGFVDVFSCHDDAKSKIYLNNGDGTFEESEIIDLTTTPASDNSGNYGSVWTDFDNDGDIDLISASENDDKSDGKKSAPASGTASDNEDECPG